MTPVESLAGVLSSSLLTPTSGFSECDEEAEGGIAVAETAFTVTVTVLASVTVIVAGPHLSRFSNIAIGLFKPPWLLSNGCPGISDERKSGTALTAVEVAPSAATLTEAGMEAIVTTDLEVRPVPVGPTRVELHRQYGTAVAPVPWVPCSVPVETFAENRG